MRRCILVVRGSIRQPSCDIVLINRVVAVQVELVTGGNANARDKVSLWEHQVNVIDVVCDVVGKITGGDRHRGVVANLGAHCGRDDTALNERIRRGTQARKDIALARVVRKERWIGIGIERTRRQQHTPIENATSRHTSAAAPAV